MFQVVVVIRKRLLSFSNYKLRRQK